MMELVFAILLIGAVLIWALGEIKNEALKNKQAPGLKRQIRNAEKKRREELKKELSDADADRVIGFLNRLRENDTRPD
jgi:Na+-transporting methylmalonyl-CoA/oxaloacetate decarboxylase gamma subunit